MWGDNAAAPLNSVHFGYGAGAVFVNLLVRPFITQKVLSIHVTYNEGINSTLSLINPTKVNSNIIIPFSITAILCFLIAVRHIFFYVVELRYRRQKLQVRQVIINQREKIKLVNKCNAYLGRLCRCKHESRQ